LHVARFFVVGIDASGRAVLQGDEAGHFARVLRLGVGAEIDVFDGRGAMFRARAVTVGRDDVGVEVVRPISPAPEPRVRVTLAMSVLKGDKMDEVVRDATMMGVAVIQPIVATRSETRLATVARSDRHARWLRVAIASVKQCGRAVVPEIRPVADLHDWLAAPRSGRLIVPVEPSASNGLAPLGDLTPSDRACIAIGPEGGWTPEELAACRTAGAGLVALGGRTLRAESAPLVALAALYEAWHVW
jgi:16S rRNA (uracil1498-N3)-methyltransferase